MAVPVTGNPKDFNFVHNTISLEFFQGKLPKSKGENLDKAVSDIAKKKVDVNGFPPLPIFTIDDPNGIYGTMTFSLSNRRLYVFTKSRAASVKIRQATFQETINSLWKMTSVSRGYDYPNLTKFGDKEAQPGVLLGDFRTFCEQNAAVHNLEQIMNQNFNLRFT